MLVKIALEICIEINILFPQHPIVALIPVTGAISHDLQLVATHWGVGGYRTQKHSLPCFKSILAYLVGIFDDLNLNVNAIVSCFSLFLPFTSLKL